MEILKIPALRSPVMLIAFSGWNDAADAATGAASHILGAWTDGVHAVDEQPAAYERDVKFFYIMPGKTPFVIICFHFLQGCNKILQ